jgi:membrane protease YdiL (CAAX protease family)
MRSRIASWMRSHVLTAFFLITFSVSWISWFAVFLVPMPRLWRLILNQAGLAGPLLSSVIVIGVLYGRVGVRRFIGRILQWLAGIQWYLFVLFGAAALCFAAIGLYILGGGAAPAVVLAVAPGALLSGFREEYGWRGLALPRLQERYSAWKASIVIGVIWALWHLPILPFIRMGLPGLTMMIIFLLEVVALSLLMAWVYNHTAGSLLLPVLYHTAYNLTLAVLSIPTVIPLWLIYLALTWMLVIVIMLRCGTARLSRGPVPPADVRHFY